MSVSGYLRSELGHCVEFNSSMLPDKILNRNIQQETFVKVNNKSKQFVLKINPAMSDVSNIESQNSIMEENEQTQENSINTKTSPLEKLYSFAGIFGVKVEELLSMFGFNNDTKTKEVQQNLPPENPFNMQQPA